MSVKDIDLGWKKIVEQLRIASTIEVVVGVMAGDKNSDGVQIAEYAAYNEYGTSEVPSRPFMRTSFDENIDKISADLKSGHASILRGRASAVQALTKVGEKHVTRIQNTITGRDFLPKLSPKTVSKKRGSTKTLVDTGAMVNSIKSSIRGKS